MKKLSNEPLCFVVSLREIKKYGLSPAEQLKKNPEEKRLFPEKSKEVRKCNEE